VRLHHVQLAIPAGGEDVARRFYVDGLGLTEVDHRERETFPGHLRLHTFDGHGNRVELLAPAE
jgi:catechol 2,3-dioxygenase-like lactoylglutathione lyase family enzyme